MRRIYHQNISCSSKQISLLKAVPRTRLGPELRLVNSCSILEIILLQLCTIWHQIAVYIKYICEWLLEPTYKQKITRKNIVNPNRSSDKEVSSPDSYNLNAGSSRATDDLKDGSDFVYLFKLKAIAPSLTEPLRSLMLSQPDRMPKREYVLIQRDEVRFYHRLFRSFS